MACAATLLWVGLTVSASAQTPAQAAGWPTPGKPIRFVGPGSPGSSSDVLGRLIADHVGRNLGAPVLMDQKPGGGTLLAAEHVARSPADGYTFMVASVAPLAIAPALYQSKTYDPVRDFAGVARLVTLPNVLVVNKDLPIRTVQELAAYARARPGQVNYGAVSGTSSHFSSVLLGNGVNGDFTLIPYKSNTESLLAVMKGEVHFTIDNLLLLLPQIQAGAVRALAITAGKRSGELPDLPTMIEAGVPGYDVSSWFGLVAPAGTPKPIIDRLSIEVGKALQEPEIVAQIRKLGADPAMMTPAEFDAFYRAENARWVPIVRQSGAKPN